MRKSKLFEIIMAMALLTALIFSMTTAPTSAGESGGIPAVGDFDDSAQADIYYADSFADLQSGIAAYGAAAGDMIITVGADIPVTSGLTIPDNPYGKTITITSGDVTRTLTRQYNNGMYAVDSMFVVGAGASMILENIIIDGNKGAYPGYTSQLVFVDGGRFTMKDGAILTNNGGGGVYVQNGEFTMNGGEISGNFANWGGGVYIDESGEFTMNGGEISGNTAYLCGGVCVQNGEFTMNGGEIRGNTADWGSGVLIGGSGIMNGGEISGNTTMYDGGGVFVVDIGEFTMNGGEISGNTAGGGGGVAIESGKFTMVYGKISDNTATYQGGGVYFEPIIISMEDDAVLMNNSGNTSRYEGCCDMDELHYGEFTMLGGEISGNFAEQGGGVHMWNGEFTMLGGKISDNSAEYGGGVYVYKWLRSDLILGGAAVISGNTNNNVYYNNTGYIKLSTENPPVPGMEVWVTKAADDGVIVESGAREEDAAYFLADEYGMKVRYEEGGRLRIVEAAFYEKDLPDLRIIGYTPISSTRVGLVDYDYTLAVTVTNYGGAAENVTARLIGSKQDTVAPVSDVILSFGSVSEGATVTSEAFTVRVNRTVVFDASQLVFTFDYDK